ncbi:MAG: hypothetical protein J6K92_04875 [Oscillospiraceae bacterium]|nr:hypothetical protein [Oscillospiraceae bacterium]
MHLKNILLFISIAVLIIAAFAGCGNSKNKPYCTLTVYTSYGGCGIDGQDLGSGSFSEDFRVVGGECFYEDFDGHWTLDPKGMSDDSVIARIVKVEADGVTVQVGGEERTLAYSSECKVASMYVVCDGINYDHKIRFSGYTE